jgi:hypothetical protein
MPTINVTHGGPNALMAMEKHRSKAERDYGHLSVEDHT